MKNFDNSFLTGRIKLIAGVDEAGRGPLSGPVVAAAVIFDSETFIEGINDSKKIKETRREELYPLIISKAKAYSITAVTNWEIDRINILQATLLAMKTCIVRLNIPPDLVLIDGNKACDSLIPVKTIIGGDAKSFSIAAASILAKVTRDRIMKRLSVRFPEYNWEKNKGYGTREHITLIKQYGACCLHRKSFLKNIIAP
ncbi:MAG: ribonuclease HII [Bacteroidota bacterium]|nr:ribonuclease HII [Bacteroidota bacterium]